MTADDRESGEWISREVVVQNTIGVHTRPSVRIAIEARKFSSQICLDSIGAVIMGETSVDSPGLGLVSDAKSSIAVLMMALRQGCRIRIRARGPDAQEAVNAIAQLFDENFGDWS